MPTSHSIKYKNTSLKINIRDINNQLIWKVEIIGEEEDINKVNKEILSLRDSYTAHMETAPLVVVKNNQHTITIQPERHTQTAENFLYLLMSSFIRIHYREITIPQNCAEFNKYWGRVEGIDDMFDEMKLKAENMSAAQRQEFNGMAGLTLNLLEEARNAIPDDPSACRPS